MKQRGLEISVGALIILGILALLFLALKVSGLSSSDTWFGPKQYVVTANFANIGSLKVRSPVRIAGVKVGSVAKISLDPTTFQAVVSFKISGQDDKIPTDSSASITSSGLLGDNYVSLTPGYNTQFLVNDGKIETTYAATSLESLMSTFLSGSKKK